MRPLVFMSLLLLLWQSHASAYVLERAESGELVHWNQSCVTWWMEASGCGALTPEETREVLRASFQAWDEYEGMYVDFEEGGVSCVESAGLDDTGPLNIAVWRKGLGSWPYPARVVGLTTLTFDKETGEIVDADMEFNEEDFDFSHDKEPNTYDLQHAVTHEVGHILGLGHSAVRSSVMYETAGPEAWNKRRLDLDDKEGVSTNHGIEDAPAISPCGLSLPQGSFETPFCPDEDVEGCAVNGGKNGPVQLIWIGLVALFLWQRRRVYQVTSLALLMTLVGGLVMPQAAKAATCEPYRIPGGEAIYWTVDSVTLAIDSNLPEGIDADAMISSVTTGLSAWTDIPCVTMEVDFRDDGNGLSDCPGEVLDDELGCIYWVGPDESWPFGSGLIAVTLVHHNAVTGEIVDTDMAINGTGTFSWSAPPICDMDTADHDLIATLTHEFGHFFGLNHSSAPQSVMEAATGPGDCDKRTLADFDRECLCDTLEETQPLIEATHDAFVEPSPDASIAEDTTPAAEPAPPAADGCGQPNHGPSKLFILLSLLCCAYPAKRRRRSTPRPSQAR